MKFSSLLIEFLIAPLLLAEVLRIGTLHPSNTIAWKNVRQSIDEWNQENAHSRNGSYPRTEIIFELISPSESFTSIETQFCDVIQRRVVAIQAFHSCSANINGLSELELQLFFSMCKRFRVPCFVDKELPLVKNENTFVFSMAPPHRTVSKSLAELISQLSWNSFLLLYKEPEELESIASEIFSTLQTEFGARTLFKAFQLPKQQTQYPSFLKFIRERHPFTNFVIHTDDLIAIHSLILQASRMNMTNGRYSYLFTTLDLHLLETFLTDGEDLIEADIIGIRFSNGNSLPQRMDSLVAVNTVQLIGESLGKVIQSGHDLEPRYADYLCIYVFVSPNPIRICNWTRFSALLCDANDWWLDGGLFVDILNSVDN